MSEKTEELYKKYFEEKLDAIFNVDREEYKKNNDSNEDKDNQDGKRPESVTVTLSNGYAVVYKDGKWNFIDTTDKLVSEEWYDDVESFSNGLAMVRKNGKYNYIDTNGKLISEVWYDDAWKFNEGYAKVKKNGHYNLIDTNGKLISEEWYDEIYYFKDGYARVEKNYKYKIIDTNGKLISEEWYDVIGGFEDGYAQVKKNDKYNFIDTNGKLISEEWYDDALEFNEGYAIVGKNYKYNFIDTNGKLISEEWYNGIGKFKDGYAIVKKNGKYNFIDTNGKLISEEWYDVIGGFKDGYAQVEKDGKYNFIDNHGNLALDKWYDKLELISRSFVKVDKIVDEYYPTKKNNYIVKKVLTGYECSKDNNKFKVKYKPIKIFGLRYVMCLNKDKIYLYDRKTNTYESIGNVYTIEYDDNLIFDKNNKKVYLMYDDKKTDITDYYNKYLKDKGEIKIKEGIKLLTKDDFFYHSEDEIRKLVEEEKVEEEKIRKEKEKEEEKRKLEEIKKADKLEQKKMQIRRDEALFQIQKSLKVLENLEKVTGSYAKIKVGNIFIEVGDHKEINPIYIETGMLKHIDFSYESFKNVKINGIDFRGCNITLRPQEVYEKNLSGCNFEGLFIDPFMNFNGVDIRGCKFSDDKDFKTLDRQNVTFKNAIYDETTTYNGIPFPKIYGECKNSSSIKK